MKIIAKEFTLEATIVGELIVKVEAQCSYGSPAARNAYGYPTEMATAPTNDILAVWVDGTKMEIEDAAKMFGMTLTEFEERCEEEAWDEFTDWN